MGTLEKLSWKLPKLGLVEWKGTKEPAALHYFEKIGVDPHTAVKLIVASHWHDDHIRGLSQVVAACPNAKFVCSAAFTNKEFLSVGFLYTNRPMIQSKPGPEELLKTLKLVVSEGRNRDWSTLKNEDL